ncbi:MAG: cytochrome c oxidase subunit 3 [Acidobacteria bacterium]|nr:cytochrome c oxidase subunit 3 [Acidobacteriota bacterium]
MATIAPPPPLEYLSTRDPDLPTWSDGDGEGDSHGPQALPERRYLTGLLLGLAAVVMFFTALTSAYVVNQGISGQWEQVPLPRILWASTVILLLSSLAIEKARRAKKHFGRWWEIATLLGVLFLSAQLAAFRRLASAGIYMDTNPASSFFYLLTGAHAIHLLGGLTALLYIWIRSRREMMADHIAVKATAIYWHFMDGLWLWLFLLLLLWR